MVFRGTHHLLIQTDRTAGQLVSEGQGGRHQHSEFRDISQSWKQNQTVVGDSEVFEVLLDPKVCPGFRSNLSPGSHKDSDARSRSTSGLNEQNQDTTLRNLTTSEPQKHRTGQNRTRSIRESRLTQFKRNQNHRESSGLMVSSSESSGPSAEQEVVPAAEPLVRLPLRLCALFVCCCLFCCCLPSCSQK